MPIYRLRFFFDPGSGTCLWAGNDAARARWEYAIDAQRLPLPESTWRSADDLCRWFDTSIDWAYPPDPSPWDAAELAKFNLAAQGVLGVLRDQLGPDFEVIDESGTSVAA